MAESSLEVRTGHVDNVLDVDALARLVYDWRVLERNESGLEFSAYRDALAEWMREHEESHVAFLGSAGGDAVAMAWLAVVHRVPSPVTFERTCAYVQSVYVAPDHRNHGAGTVLVSALVDHARAAGLDYIAVHPSERSFPFYRRLGFAGTERVLELDFRPGRTST